MGSKWALNGKFSFFQPLFAFEYKEVFPENGWKVYDPTWEYKRQVGTVPCPSSSTLLFRSEALCSDIITGCMEQRMIPLTNVVQTGLGHRSHIAVTDDSTVSETVTSTDGDRSGCRELILGFGRKN